jgi:predicted RNase H-like HicB family nuclease
MYRYRMVLRWSEPDQLWVVYVPELPGCVADGATPEEAVQNAQDVIANWIAFAQEHGRDVPEPQSVDVSAAR